jgi:hypothetical protein
VSPRRCWLLHVHTHCTAVHGAALPEPIARKQHVTDELLLGALRCRCALCAPGQAEAEIPGVPLRLHPVQVRLGLFRSRGVGCDGL